jgi:hypothetical protein
MSFAKEISLFGTNLCRQSGRPLSASSMLLTFSLLIILFSMGSSFVFVLNFEVNPNPDSGRVELKY